MEEKQKKSKDFLFWAQWILIFLCVVCAAVLVLKFTMPPAEESQPTQPVTQPTEPSTEPTTEPTEEVEQIPQYIYDEADRVVQTLDKEAFLMAIVSDVHLGTVQEDTSNIRSANTVSDALQVIGEKQPLDMLAMLGDYTIAGNVYKKQHVLQDLATVRDIFQPISSQLPTVFLQGNHDTNHYANANDPNEPKLNQQEIFEQLGKYNTAGTADSQNPYGNYGFVDFEEEKLRVIYMNTCESEIYEIGISQAQLEWLTREALDVTDKEDGDQWNILILSHHPLDWNYRTMFVVEILEDYQQGKADKMPSRHDDTKYEFAYDFSDMEQRATIVANIHGHVHNFTSNYIGDNGWLLRVSVPNASVDRNNQYDDAFAEVDENGEKVYWEKTDNTEEATSFCVVAVDTTNHTVSLSCFGAGYDRVLTYKPYKK